MAQHALPLSLAIRNGLDSIFCHSYCQSKALMFQR